MKNQHKMEPKSMLKSMKNQSYFGTCGFLFFAKCITLNCFFYMIRGHQKSVELQLVGPLNSDAFRGRVFGNILISSWEGFGSFWGAVDTRMSPRNRGSPGGRVRGSQKVTIHRKLYLEAPAWFKYPLPGVGMIKCQNERD